MGRSYSVKDPKGFAGDIGADAISGEDCDLDRKHETGWGGAEDGPPPLFTAGSNN